MSDGAWFLNAINTRYLFARGSQPLNVLNQLLKKFRFPEVNSWRELDAALDDSRPTIALLALLRDIMHYNAYLSPGMITTAANRLAQIVNNYSTWNSNEQEIYNGTVATFLSLRNREHGLATNEVIRVLITHLGKMQEG